MYPSFSRLFIRIEPINAILAIVEKFTVPNFLQFFRSSSAAVNILA